MVSPGVRIAWDLLRARRAGPDGIADRQRARLQQLVAHARATSPFYREHLRALHATDWRLADIPPVNKSELMADFDNWVTDPRFARERVMSFLSSSAAVGTPLDGALIATSSGVTGQPGVFVHDEFAVAVCQAMIVVRGYLAWLRWPQISGFLRHGVREAAIVGTGGHFAGVSWLERARQRAPWVSRVISVHSAQSPIAALVRELTTVDPTALVGYTSVLRLLADEQIAGRLAIHPLIAATSGETATDGDRALLARAFDCPIKETYACSEALFFGFGCDQRWLHVSADWVIVEPVQADGSPTPPGVFSDSVLLTNLANRTAPLLRYQLGDSVMRRADRCPCGNPLPAFRVAGRRDDTLVMHDATGQPVAISPVAFGLLAEAVPGVRNWQIVQVDRTTLTVRVSTDPTAAPTESQEAIAEAFREHLMSVLRAHGVGNVTLVIQEAQLRPDAKNGKFRHVYAL